MKSTAAAILTAIALPVAAAPPDDMADHAGFAHAMDVRTVRIDHFPVVFHYGQVRPEFTFQAGIPTTDRRLLDAGWKFRFDPANEGGNSGWAAESQPPGDWTDIRVPHCWDMMPGGRFHDWRDTTPANPPHYNGAAWHPHKGQPHFEHADAVGFNEYRGAMDPFEELDPDMTRTAAENPGKPIIIMENGAWSKLGSRGTVDRRGTEDWQADLLKRQHAVLTRHMPPLAGYTYWLLTDYRSRKFYTAGTDAAGYSAMGLYSPDGKPKLVRDVFRDLDWKPAAK